MRLRLAAALLLAIPLSGCMAFAPRTQLLDREPFTLEANATWSRDAFLDTGARHEVRYEVAAEAGALRVCFVPDSGFAQPEPDRWGDDLWLDILGCGLARPGAPFAASEEVDGGPGRHVLYARCEPGAPCRGFATLQTRSVSAGSTAFLLLGGVILLILVLRVLADRLDRARIRDFVARRGGRVERIAWRPLGRGWFGERGERIYHVRFVDAEGRPREASFKTSLFSGVWTDAA